MYDLEATDDASWEKEISTWPESVRVVAKKYPAFKCWTSANDRTWHVRIIDYARVRHPTRPDVVLLELVHGRGTPKAGEALKHADPSRLVLCGCGTWEDPTRDEVRAAHLRNGSLPPLMPERGQA
jgi:hypothetical protein